MQPMGCDLWGAIYGVQPMKCNPSGRQRGHVVKITFEFNYCSGNDNVLSNLWVFIKGLCYRFHVPAL